jgi:serine protein kinase
MNSPIAGVPQRHSELLKSLAEFGKQHRAARWAGTFSSFLEGVFPTDPHGIARSSHQYIWDMMRVEGLDDSAGRLRCQLF